MASSLHRHIESEIREDIKDKMILLSGPRQCGKTTLAKHLFSKVDYYNYDIPEDRARLLKKQWLRNGSLVVLDELHKLKNWKNFLN